MGDKKSRGPSKKLIGLRIDKRREELGLKKVELARACETNEGNLHKWIKGKQKPGMDKLILLSRALQMSIDDLTAPPPGEPESALERQLVDEMSGRARNDAERELIAETIKRSLAAVAAQTGSAPAQGGASAAESPEQSKSSTPLPAPKPRKRRA